MTVKLSNNATTKLSSSIANDATSLAVQDASAFPSLSAGEWFPATIVDSSGNMEIVKVTARSGATFTIERGQEGTIARSFIAGSRIDIRLTEASLVALINDRLDAAYGNVDDTSDADKPVSTAQAEAIAARIPHYASGSALPTSDIGPIWHADYNGLMIWQVFDANGADYTGYASVDIGIGRTEIIPTPRTGWIKRNGASLSKTTYAALRAWAMHNGLFVAIGSWAAGTSNFADNADGTTFKIPDVRGEFPRYTDDGRGADSGRALGTAQGSQNLSHAHGVNDPGHAHGVYDPGHKHDIWGQDNNASASGGATNELANVENPTSYNRRDTGWSGTGIGIYGSGTGISIQSSGGSEARGRNTSELAVIKF